MPDLISNAYHHVSHVLLLNAVSKARVAQFQIWDDSAQEGILGARQVDSLSSILIAWLSVEGLVNEAEHYVFKGKKAKLADGLARTHENRLRACVALSAGEAIATELGPTFLRLEEARRFRNRLVHYSSQENPSQPRWEGRLLPAGMGVGWMVGAPPSQYTEGLMEQIDPERAWQFCGVALDVAVVVYKTLGLAPEFGEMLATEVKIDPECLPRQPTLSDLMAGIPIWRIERYWRALRVAQQYTEQWWVLDPDGRRRPYRPGMDLKPETMLTAFEGEPSEERLGDLWQDYWETVPPMAMKTKRIIKNAVGEWCLADPFSHSDSESDEGEI